MLLRVVQRPVVRLLVLVCLQRFVLSWTVGWHALVVCGLHCEPSAHAGAGAAMSHRILDMRTALKQALLEVHGKVVLKM
jgi:hypothetical protein